MLARELGPLKQAELAERAGRGPRSAWAGNWTTRRRAWSSAGATRSTAAARIYLTDAAQPALEVLKVLADETGPRRWLGCPRPK